MPSMEATRLQPYIHPAPALDATVDAAEQDPLLESAGRFQDDPFWDDMMESIRRHRREMDAEWDDAE